MLIAFGAAGEDGLVGYVDVAAEGKYSKLYHIKIIMQKPRGENAWRGTYKFKPHGTLSNCLNLVVTEGSDVDPKREFALHAVAFRATSRPSPTNAYAFPDGKNEHGTGVSPYIAAPAWAIRLVPLTRRYSSYAKEEYPLERRSMKG